MENTRAVFERDQPCAVRGWNQFLNLANSAEDFDDDMRSIRCVCGAFTEELKARLGLHSGQS